MEYATKVDGYICDDNYVRYVGYKEDNVCFILELDTDFTNSNNNNSNSRNSINKNIIKNIKIGLTGFKDKLALGTVFYGTIFKTNNGLNWQDLSNSMIQTDLYDVYAIDSLKCYTVGDSSKILHTTNGGINWEAANLGNDCKFNSISGSNEIPPNR